MTKARAGIVRRAVAVALLLLLFPVSPGAIAQQAAGVELRDVTVSTQPDSVTVRVKTSGEPKYQAELMDHPYRLVVDFDDTSYGWRKTPLSVDADPLKQIRGSQYKRGVARIVVELTRTVGYAIREESSGLAMVIPTSPAAAPAAARATAEPVVATAKPVAPKPVAAPAAPKPQATAALAVKPEAPKAEAVKPDPMQPQTAPEPKAEAAPMPALPQVAQAQVPPAPAAPPAPVPIMRRRPAVARGSSRSTSRTPTSSTCSASSPPRAAGTSSPATTSRARCRSRCKNVTWDQALDTILEAGASRRSRRTACIRIVSHEQLTKEREAQARVEEPSARRRSRPGPSMAEAQLKEHGGARQKRLADAAAAEEQAARGPLREETIRLSYADPEEVAKTLQGILGIPPEGTGPTAPDRPGPAGVIVRRRRSRSSRPRAQTAGRPAAVVRSARTCWPRASRSRRTSRRTRIFIRHYEADLERIKKLIREQLDIPLPQVKIEARMEILDRNALEAIGVQWGGGGAGNVGSSTLVGQGFQPTDAYAARGSPAERPRHAAEPEPHRASGVAASGQPPTGLPTGGNLVNLPFSVRCPAPARTPARRHRVRHRRQPTSTSTSRSRPSQSQGKTRTLARPEIVTVENNKATISPR